MNTFLEFALIAVPSTAAVAALLFFGRRHIHRQMDDIAEAAKAGAFKRPMRFRRIPTIPAQHRQKGFSPTGEPEPLACAATQPV